MPEPVDVVVVGGRIAGSLTALRLAARGVSVRLLEAHDFPSDTLSTHFFRGDRMGRALAEVGVLDEVLGTGAPPLVCEYFSVDGAAFEQSPAQEPGEIGYDLSVRRITLDAILARRVESSPVDLRTRTKVVDLVQDDGVVVGVVDDRGETHRATVVVGADGRRSTVARLVGAPDEKTYAPARAMYYRYATGWRNPDPVGPEFLLDGDRFAYVFPSDAGVACVTVSVRVAEHDDPAWTAAALLDKTFASNPQVSGRMPDLEWVSKTFVGVPSTSYWRRASGPGWALIGDACTHADPWSGRGMDTAALQSEAFVEAFDGTPDGWNSTYDDLRRARTYDDFFSTSLLAPNLRRIIS